MKTVCLYFQVHQPWRLKTYRFFNIGKDHNYLDDLTNRAIMQKIARECYLPMNSLLLKLIKEEGIPLSCPHGRPILVCLTKHELEVRFKRVQ